MSSISRLIIEAMEEERTEIAITLIDRFIDDVDHRTIARYAAKSGRMDVMHYILNLSSMID